MAAAGLDADGVASAEERMQGESELCKLSMEKNLALLGTLGNNAPFIGLRGTVIGIVRSFRALQSSNGQVSAGLMAEIGEALVATAIGLLVALPAVAAFNLFQRLIRARMGRATALAHEIIGFLKSSSHVSRSVNRLGCRWKTLASRSRAIRRSPCRIPTTTLRRPVKSTCRSPLRSTGRPGCTDATATC